MLVAALLGLAAVPAAATAQAPAEAGISPEAVLADPAKHEPFTYALLVQSLWSSGRRQQAAFWFYVFQERTRPWADADTRGDGAAALRSALNDELGTVINRWVASDVRAWQAIVDRALSYEAKLPLNPARPDGIGQAEWERRVAKARADYVAAARQTLFTMKPEEVAAKRREAGLPVGPLEDPGPALPDSWR